VKLHGPKEKTKIEKKTKHFFLEIFFNLCFSFLNSLFWVYKNYQTRKKLQVSKENLCTFFRVLNPHVSAFKLQNVDVVKNGRKLQFFFQRFNIEKKKHPLNLLI
jgi:hypothetical protein